jgi:hypothetical protein
MSKIDLRKELKHLYNPAKKFVIVNVPPMNFLKIDGAGDPNTSQAYQDAIQTLFSLSYTLKFMIKKASDVDCTVMPLEGLWWTDDMAAFSPDNKSLWHWTAMMMQPEYVTAQAVETARQEVEKKKKLAALDKVRFEPYHEGPAAQILYIGPFSGEGPTITRLHEFIREQGGEVTGRHHEIYLSDFRRVAPEKLKTVIRQPMTVSG